jgi:hypothetical protein
MGTFNTHVGLVVGGLALIAATEFGGAQLGRPALGEWFYVLLGAGVLAIGLGLAGLVLDGIRSLRHRGQPDQNAGPTLNISGGQQNINFYAATPAAVSPLPVTTAIQPILPTKSQFSHERIRIADLPLEQNLFLRDKSFEDCVLAGPALLAPFRDVTFDHCGFGGDPESIVWTIPNPKFVVGAIGIERCTFRRCTFEAVGLAHHQKDVKRTIDALRPSK